MKTFDYCRARSFEEAAELKKEGAAVIAGGTDMLGVLKTEILEDAPECIVNMKTIPNASFIEVNDDKVRIGAMTKLSEIAENKKLQDVAPIICEAAHSVATPIIRNSATLGGNLCQDVRCWFYRYPHEIGGRLNCARKGGEQCYGIQGDNRYHSIFGGMKTGTTECSAECPAGTDIPGYMQKIREDDWDAAADIIMRYNPLPMLTSRICPHTCQEKCNQCKHGDSVGIHTVERTLGDFILENADKFYRRPEQETGKKVGIVGGGPAGLTAAYYLRRTGHEVTIYERMAEAGGVLMYGVPEYRLPKHYVRDVVKALENMGIEFRTNCEVGKDITVEEIESSVDAVFLDTGAWKQPILGIDGENLTQFGLNFLVEVKGFMQKQIGKHVLVCGGGNVAMDVALTAKRLGAESVTLVCLEQRYEMPASDEEIARAEEEGVVIHNGRGLKEVVYDGNTVKGMITNKCTSVRDENGRFSPQYDDSDLQTFSADSVILATGQRVDLDFLGDRFKEELRSARGLVEVGEHNETRRKGIYAGGDLATGPSIAIKAIRDGANAARNIAAYLGSPIEHHLYEEGLITCDATGIKETKARVERDTPVAERRLDVEDSTSLSKADAREEARRCMNCGCYSVNASDLSPVMIALDADIVTNKKTISASDFFTTKLKASDMLDRDEVITAVEFPVRKAQEMHYDKFRLRNSVDFAMVSTASVLAVKDGVVSDARIVLGGVAPVPMRRSRAESYIIGKAVTEETAETAAEIALEEAVPLEHNAHKVEIAKSLIKTALMRCR